MNTTIQSYCRITNNQIIVNGKSIDIERSNNDSKSWLSDIYRVLKPEYPKFFKMDSLSKSGFLASEFLLKEFQWDKNTEKKDISIILSNSSASLENDTIYQATIQDSENYFPSPSVFVYTLANIVSGEIAIRNKIMGETSFYIMEKFDSQEIINLSEISFLDKTIEYVICGWVEYFQNNCDVLMMLINKNRDNKLNFNKEEINKLYNI